MKAVALLCLATALVVALTAANTEAVAVSGAREKRLQHQQLRNRARRNFAGELSRATAAVVPATAWADLTTAVQTFVAWVKPLTVRITGASLASTNAKASQYLEVSKLTPKPAPTPARTAFETQVAAVSSAATALNEQHSQALKGFQAAAALLTAAAPPNAANKASVDAAAAALPPSVAAYSALVTAAADFAAKTSALVQAGAAAGPAAGVTAQVTGYLTETNDFAAKASATAVQLNIAFGAIVKAVQLIQANA